MSSLLNDIVPDSEEERDQQNRISGEENFCSNSDERINIDVETRVKQAFTKLFCVGHQFRFQFPESFSTVPAVEAANQVWGEAADITEVVEQLKGERDNKGLSAVPDSVLRCFNAIVGLATEKIAKLQQRLKANEHHLGTASKAKAGEKYQAG